MDIAELLLGKRAALEAKDNRGPGPKVRGVVGQRRGWTPLHCAAIYSTVKMAELLVILGAELKATNNKGQGPSSV